MTMARLLVKDIFIIRKNILLAALLGLLFMLLTDLNVLVGFTAIAYLLVSQSMMKEEREQTGVFMACLPLERRVIVRSKYAGMLLHLAIAAVIVLASGVLLRLFDPSLPIPPWTEPFWAGVAIVVIASCLYPLSVVLDRVVMQYVSFGSIMLYVMSITVIRYVAESLPLSSAQLAAAGGAAAVAVYLLSYALTVRLYENKDL